MYCTLYFKLVLQGKMTSYIHVSRILLHCICLVFKNEFSSYLLSFYADRNSFHFLRWRRKVKKYLFKQEISTVFSIFACRKENEYTKCTCPSRSDGNFLAVRFNFKNYFHLCEVYKSLDGNQVLFFEKIMEKSAK